MPPPHPSPQADCVKHRSEIIQSLTPQQFGQLWDSLRQCKYRLSPLRHVCALTADIGVVYSVNFDDFWSINRKLMLNARSDHEPFKKIPIAIYRVSTRPP